MIRIHGIGQYGILTRWPSIIKTSLENRFQNHWKALEEQLIIEQKVSDSKYAALKADEAAAKAVEDKVTEDALARSERLFKQFKQYESELSATLKEAGRTDDPYRASLPDDYKDPTESSTEPSKEETKPSTESSTEPSKEETKPSTESSTEPSKEETKPSTESSTEPSKGRNEAKHRVKYRTKQGRNEAKHRVKYRTKQGRNEAKHRVKYRTKQGRNEAKHRVKYRTKQGRNDTKHRIKYRTKQGRNKTKHQVSTEPSKEETTPSTESSTEPSKEETKPNSSTTIVPTNSNSVSTVGRPVLPTNSYILVDQATGIVLQNPDFAQGGYSLLVEVLKDVKELAGKDYKAYNIQLSNQNNPIHQISPTVVTIPVNGQKK